MTDMPWWFLLGSSGLAVIVAGLWARWFLALWRRSRERPESMGDEWDPFAE